MARATSNLADVVAQFASSIVGRGCTLILQVFLARSLGPREFGLYAIGWTVAGLLGTLAPVGMPQAVIRYGISGRRALSAAPIAMAAVAGLICMVAILATAGPLARGLFGEPLAASAIASLAPSVPLLAVFGVLISGLRASQANLASAAVGMLVLVLYLAVTVLAFSTGIGRTPAVAGHAYSVAILLTIIPAAWMLRRLPPGHATPARRQMLQFGVVTMLISSANLLNLWADRLVIGVMTDARSVGIYQIASQLAVVAIVVRAAVTSVFESRVPKMAAAGATVPEITREYSQALRLMLHVSAPGLVCLALTAGFWTETLFGHAYRAAALPLTVLVLGQLAACFIGPSVNALHMTGGEHSVMRLTIATSIMNVLGNVALIPVLGLVGSAIAFGAANVAVSGACMFQLWRTGRVRLHATMLGDIALATAAAAGATALVAHWLGSTLPAVIADLMVCYLVYAVLVSLLCRTDDEALEFGRGLRRRLAGGRRTPSRMPIP